MRAYRPDIDGLRAVAILAVVACHAGLLAGGFVGVDVFFVISGFLITGILQAELAAEQFSLARFYGRRIRRIFPALLTVLTAAWLFGWLALLPAEYAQLGKHLGGASLFVSNLVLFRETGYFDQASATKPLLHLWSLGVEEQFYILWPLLLAGAWALGRYVLGLVLVLFAGSLLANLLLTAPYPEMSFFLPFCRFWELMAGGLLAWAQAHGMLQRNRRHALSLLGLGLILTACITYRSTDIFPGWRALLPVGGAVALIAAGSEAWVNRHLLSARPMVWVGLISYPLYLWHWPLLSYARILLSGEPPLAVRLGAVVAAFGLAWLTYHCIEQPVRRRATPRALWLLLAWLLALGGLGLLTMQQRGFPQRAGLHDLMLVDLGGTDDFRKTLLRCPANYHGEDLSWCYLSQPGAPRLALFGDSHADHLFPGIVAQHPAPGWLLIGHSSCPPLVDIAEHQPGKSDRCVEKNQRALRAIVAEPNIHTVVLATLSTFYVGGSISPQIAQDKPQIVESVRADERGLPRPELFYRGMDRSILALEKAHKRVVFFMDVPELDFWPAACIARPLTGAAKQPCAVPRAAHDASVRDYRALVARLKAAHPNLEVYDPTDGFCDARFCYATRPGMLRYHDTHHLGLRGSAEVAQRFLPWLHASGLER